MEPVENGNGQDKKIAFGGFDLETELQTLRRGAVKIHLAKRPFSVLLFLIENRERVVSRDELLEKFWDGRDVYDDALRKCVGAIRKAIDDTENPPRFIETRRGSGYRFVGAVEEANGNGAGEFEQTNGNHQPAEKSFAAEKTSERGEIQPDGEKSEANFGLAKRLILTIAFAVVLIFVAALAFFVNRQTTENTKAKTLTEIVAAKRSIAILPLKNLTGDAKNDYLSDGITESLINEVSRVESLKVISRGSAFQFKDKDASAQEIAQKLGVETILEGGLKQSGEQIRVEVRLVSAKDGSVLWASSSEQKKMSDIFAIQDGIACQIVAELKAKLCGETAPAAHYTNNVKAYQLYLQGLYFRNQLDENKAIDFFSRALKIDPNYALAHEGLASTYAVMELNSRVPPGTVAPLAETHANRALELDDSLAGAYLALGAVKTLNSYDLATREIYYRKALLKNPNHRTAHLWLSNIYTARGEFEQAETEAMRAQEIDPLSYGVRLTLADIYYYWRKPDRVIEQAELMLALRPGDTQAMIYIILASARKGDFDRAFAELEKIPSDDEIRTFVLFAAGRINEAEKFAETVVNSEAAKNNPYGVAGAYALFGDKDAAFALLEKSYAMRQANLISIKVDPMLDNLRDDARYQDLLRRVHLAD